MAELTLEEMLKEIDEHGERLTTWETKFVDRMMKNELGFTMWERMKIRGIFFDRVPSQWR